MKNISLVLILIVASLWSCNKDHLPNVDSNNKPSDSPIKASIDTTSIRQKIEALETELTALKTQFTYRQHNLPVPSYYHKNWWGNYTLQGLALMAGVDSAGIFFLIDSYNCSGPRWPEEGEEMHFPKPMEECDSLNSRLELRMKDTTVKVLMRPSTPEKIWPQRKPTIVRDMIISTGYFCTDYYPIIDNPKLVHMLADPTVGSFKFYRYCDGQGRGDLGRAEKRDRNGIRDCARLSELITELNALRDSIGE